MPINDTVNADGGALLPVVPSTTFDLAYAVLQTFLASVDAKLAAQVAEITALKATQIDQAKVDALLAALNAATARLAAL